MVPDTLHIADYMSADPKTGAVEGLNPVPPVILGGRSCLPWPGGRMASPAGRTL